MRFGLEVEFSSPLGAWTSVEVKGCREFEEGGEKCCEPCSDDDAQFWSVYIRYVPDDDKGVGGADCIGDFETRRDAEMHASFLTELAKSFVGEREHQHKHDVIIALEGGLCSGMENHSGKALSIQVRDFDTEGAEDERLSKNEDGDEFVETAITLTDGESW